MGSLNERADLLRILLANDNEVNAFVLQCAINRLSQPCAFVRVENRALLPQKIRSFDPQFLVVSGSFTTPGELMQIKRFTNGCLIICMVNSPAEAEASLSAGAADCILHSQQDELGACLQKHLSGDFREPHFRTGQCSSAKPGLSFAERKLNEFDRRVGVFLRRLAGSVQTQWKRFKHATRLGYSACLTWLDRTHRRFKVKYLLRKQQRLVHSPIPIEPNRADPTVSALPAMSRPAEAAELHETRLQSQSDIGRDRTDSVEPRTTLPADALPGDVEEDAAFRALELSFKTLFHTALDPMFLLDGLGSVLHVNPAACALLGLQASNILGKNFFTFVPLAAKTRAFAMWDALLIEGQQKIDLALENSSGDQRDVYVSARTNLWFGVHLLIARDQTELKSLRAPSHAGGAVRVPTETK